MEGNNVTVSAKTDVALSGSEDVYKRQVENNDKEPAIISEVMYDLKNEILAIIETLKFYNQNPFSGLVYTLTSNGEVSLELTYGDK